MSCNSPLGAYRYYCDTEGKHKVVFSPPRQEDYEQIVLPCGRCIGCRLEKTRQWGLRAEHESKFHDDNCFITLTYNEENLPPSLEKRPLQLFLKKLRKKISPIKIKYIASGELGENYDNPHYHICLFGYMPDDLKHLYKKEGADYYTSKIIENLWNNGFVIVTALNFATARYTAKYAIKKELGKKEKTRPAEFFVCSRGIGEAHAKKYSSDMAIKGKTLSNGHSSNLPRYYKNKIHENSMEDSIQLNKTLDERKNKLIKLKIIKKCDIGENEQRRANEMIKQKIIQKNY